ncbi:MAG: nitric oxide reductase transcriptional regulator NorR [bacterium]
MFSIFVVTLTTLNCCVLDNLVVGFITMDLMTILVAISNDLTSALSARDRYQHLLDNLKRAIPYDAAALMRVEGDQLKPVAISGLSRDVLGRRYQRKDHPRLAIICESKEPIRFPADTALPDPFDGAVSEDLNPLARIHSCLGYPLYSNSKLIGLLTMDAFDPTAFDRIDPDFLNAVGAIAGAHMQTTWLIEALEMNTRRQGDLLSDLMQDIQMHRGNEIIGQSALISHLKREINLVARSDFTVLVTGETGVGKELVARGIHAASNRRDKPVLYLNCAALPENLADSELFGHKQGAFTGAHRDRMGKFEMADGGTLFLDEIGELPLAIQAKLLRAIQEGEIQKVGSEKPIHVNVRLLAATNRDLEMEVKAGRFRSDLFHRLNVYPIHVPALRERLEDIHLLAGYFCETTQRRLGIGPVRLSLDAMDVLDAYSWPGNVRELENILSRSILKASSEIPRGERVNILPSHLGTDLLSDVSIPVVHPHEFPKEIAPGQTLREAMVDFKKHVITRTLQKNKGNWAATGRDLGINRSNLHNLAKRLGIGRRNFEGPRTRFLSGKNNH